MTASLFVRCLPEEGHEAGTDGFGREGLIAICAQCVGAFKKH